MESLENRARDGPGPSMRAPRKRSSRAFTSTNIVIQGYELSEDEVRISLDDFKDTYRGADDQPEYVHWFAILELH